MAKLLDKIATDLNATGYARRSPASRVWLATMAKKFGANRIGLVNDPVRNTASAFIGKLFFFFYNPKTKDQLPYYDRFPLVLPIEMYNDGFLGLNFHYLPLGIRVKLMDALYDLETNSKMDSSTRIAASYSLLSGVARYEAFKPCLKRYLASHISSKIIEISAPDWETAIFLPVENFAKAGTARVWADSREAI